MLLLLLRQLRIFAAAAARPHPTPPPDFGGGKVPKKLIVCVGEVAFCFAGGFGVINGLVEVREAKFPHSSMAPYGLAHLLPILFRFTAH